MEVVYCGEVCWFAKAYGFISWSIDGVPQKDLFIHFSDIESDGFKTLVKGQKVSFKLGLNKHGDPKAVNLIVI
jgi:CspA family cold shock protein